MKIYRIHEVKNPSQQHSPKPKISQSSEFHQTKKKSVNEKEQCENF